MPFCRRRLTELGYPPTLRGTAGAPVVTDNGNLILDAAVRSIPDPAALDASLRAIPGVVGTGLFVGMAHTVLVWDGGRARTLTRNA
jgi:ribose 5-phosphate isomerase A